MPTITAQSLLTLEAYAKVRNSSKPEAMAHRRLRSVALGEHMTLQFEDERTIRRQIQEMLHIEKIFDEDGIQSEIDAYAALVPDGVSPATMAYAWLRRHPSKPIPITGSGRIDALREAVAALNVELTSEDWYRVWQASMNR